MGRLPAVSGSVQASPEAPMPARSRPKKSERIRGRTSGRGGFEFDKDKHAGRRSVPMPTGKSVNRMKVVGAPELGISAADEKELHRLTKRAATYFEKATFCNQPRATLASAIEFLEDLEPRLAVCQRSWGACALLSRLATNATEYRAQVAKANSAPTPPALATALPAPPSVAAPLLPSVPAAPRDRAGAHAPAPRSAQEFFASIS